MSAQDYILPYQRSINDIRYISNRLENNEAIDKGTKNYLINCADNLFRIERFMKHYSAQSGLVVSGLLVSTCTDLREFRELWKEFVRKFLRKYGIPIIGEIERYTDGAQFCQLHAHLLLFFDSSFPEDRIFGELNLEWNETWREIHKKRKNMLFGDKHLAFEPIRDGGAQKLTNYIAKAYNRSKDMPAKWGKEGNQSYLLKANHSFSNISGSRDNEIPSRTMSESNVIRWLAEKLEGYCPIAERSAA